MYTSSSSGLFPSDCKIAKLKPLYKRVSKTNPENFRPIPLLPLISKVIERIAYDQVDNFYFKIIFCAIINFYFRRKFKNFIQVVRTTSIDKCKHNRNNTLFKLNTDWEPV